uniref:Uncharacterized protein n=1 Tax=Amphimedon queenslandica TaxID=400682 RepID=A0A1X7UXD8_AMPQE
GSSLMLGMTQLLMPTIQLCRVFLEGFNVTEVAHDNSPPVTSYIVEELKLKNSNDTWKECEDTSVLQYEELQVITPTAISHLAVDVLVSGFILGGVFQSSSTHLSPYEDTFHYYNLRNENEYSNYGLGETDIY